MAGPEKFDLDDEPEEAPVKSKRPITKPLTPRDQDEAPRARRKPATDRKVPYPPPPADVPEGLTDYPESFVRQQNLLLAGLIVFLTFYVGAILFCAMLIAWCVWSFDHYPALKIAGLVFFGVWFLFLVKGFFKRHPVDKEMHVEITEDEQPVLFEFIYRLCDELDAPLPNKVFVSPDVNAAVMPRTSLINLFVEPKKDLLIGLGLVNCLNLTEFKSVMAHEFGHFSQSATSTSYSYVANRIIIDLIAGEDWFDRILNWCKQQQNAFSIIGYTFGGPLWLGRTVLWWMFKAITLQRMAVMRESEFHADLMAVRAAGSDAVPLSLFRMRFGNMCLMQAAHDMSVALDHKLHSNDMFLHQDRAAAVVRRKKKEPDFGIPPPHPHLLSGKTIQLFDPADEDVTDDIPEMRRTHPPMHELEENAKRDFVPMPVDYRSPWILFENAVELKERVTYKFYRMVFKVPKNTELDDALKVQKFIDNEHADTTYDPKYKGCYDDRPLEPGELQELNAVVRDKPWDDDRMEKVLAKLYDGCEEHAEAHSDLYKEMKSLQSGIVGRPSPKMKRKIAEIEEKQEENREWFKSFDRRVYILHVQMAAAVDRDQKDELVERYRFQAEVQRLYQESRQAFNKADAYLGAFFAREKGEINLPPDFNNELLQVLRESWKVLKNIIKDARDINLPAMKNFEEGDNLAAFILEGKMVPEPPLSFVKFTWVGKLMTQLEGVSNKCYRLHFKSVGGILKLQEQIAAKWLANREPVAAEVLDAEPIAAEVIPAEVIAADVIPAEVIPAEVIPAEVVPAEVIAAEVVPDEPIAAEVIPAEVIPAEIIPAEVIPAEVIPAEIVSAAPKSRPEYRSTVPLIGLPELAKPQAVSPPPAKPQVVVKPPTVVKPPVVVEAEVIAAEVIDAEVVEPEPPGAVFDLAALDAQPSPVSKAKEPEPPKSTAPVAPKSKAPAPPVAASDVFSLDSDEPPAKPSRPVALSLDSFSLDADDHKPAPVAPAKPPMAAKPSGTVPAPAARSAAPATAKPASGKRPPIKITLVKPGEESPLHKG